MCFSSQAHFKVCSTDISEFDLFGSYCWELSKLIHILPSIKLIFQMEKHLIFGAYLSLGNSSSTIVLLLKLDVCKNIP